MSEESAQESAGALACFIALLVAQCLQRDGLAVDLEPPEVPAVGLVAGHSASRARRLLMDGTVIEVETAVGVDRRFTPYDPGSSSTGASRNARRCEPVLETLRCEAIRGA